MPFIAPTNYPPPPDLGDAPQFNWESSFLQVLQNFTFQVTRLCNAELIPKYAQAFGQAVSSGTTVLTVTFTQPLPAMISYTTLFVPHWNTTWWLSNATSASFQLNFGTGPVGTSTCDFIVAIQSPLPLRT